MEDFDKPVNKLFNQLTAKSVYPLQKWNNDEIGTDLSFNR